MRVCLAGLPQRVFYLTSQGAGSDDGLVLESCVEAVASGDGRDLLTVGIRASALSGFV